MPQPTATLPRFFSGVFFAGALLLGASASAQNTAAPRGIATATAIGADHKIEWRAPVNLKVGKQVVGKALNFNKVVYGPDGLPQMVHHFSNRAEENFQLTNTTYTPLSSEEAALVPASFTEKQASVSSSIGLANGQPVTVLTIIPLRLNPATGQKEKLVSYSFTSRPASMGPLRQNNQKNLITNSALSSGVFHRLALTASGVYRLDHQFLNSLGLNPQQINPDFIKLYGKGGAMLPQRNAAFRHDDLVENAIMVVNNGNPAVFDPGDYVLFYGEGPHVWGIDSQQNQFMHTQNIYSDTTYYFLTVGNTPGLRVSNKGDMGATGQTFTTFDERMFYERELESIVISGRQWFGERFTSFTNSHEVIFSSQGLVPGTINLKANLVNTANGPASFQVQLNGTMLGQVQFSSVQGSQTSYGRKGFQQHTFFTPAINSVPSNLTVKLTYNGGSSPTAAGFLDYLVLNYKKELRLFGSQTSFRNRLGQSAVGGYFQVGSMQPNHLVWDITNPIRPRRQVGQFSGNNFNFGTDSINLREFIAFDPNGSLTPVSVGRVANQNLHALNLNGDLDLIIVTVPQFRAEAQRLAQHRNTHDGLNVTIVTPRQIYNEFSSGMQDITAIRDFVRMVYSRNADPNKRIHLLLFGDCSYDYKNRIQNNTNFVPVYQSPESLNDIDSHSSDDYFGFMDPHEGDWPSNAVPGETHMLDIGIGRLPVNNNSSAQVVVDKLINYDKNAQRFGKWRNMVTLVADDGDNNIHVTDAELLATKITNDYKKINLRKLYLDAFTQVSVPSGQRSPELMARLNQAVEQGSLILDYVGHGGETGWAAERILEISQINQWQNLDKLAFFVTATCEFGRYDDPSRNSGAEHILISPNGGGIGLITTTRPVYAHTNSLLNQRFFESVFMPVNGRMPRLGDVLVTTKNSSVSGINNRNFALLGDPSARLAYPEHEIHVSRINNNPVSASPDTLSALSLVRIEGVITQSGTGPTGPVQTNFNQNLHATVYEKESEIMTLGDENPTRTFNVRQNIIYDGQATVTNGTFWFEFVVPLDIAYNLDYGKISLYAHANDTDASGHNSNVLVGGSNPNAPQDSLSPQITMFMNDESFVFGGATGQNAILLAKLFDDNGINTVGTGIGHEIKATLDGSKEYILNEYYTADVNSYQSGRIRFPLKDLSPGPHNLRLKAWDTHNNSGEAYLEFVVVNSESLALQHVLNYPNPFAQHTTFHFDHNRAGDPLEVLVQVFTVSGKLVKTISQPAIDATSRSHVQSLTWDGRDDYNDRLSKGVYVYKISVRSLRDGSKTHQYQKLVILN